jgi:hypothetical protein
MAKITLTYQFDNDDELRAHLALMTRTETAPVSRAADIPAVVIDNNSPLRRETITPTEPTTPEEPTESRAADEVITADVDADGLPYDAEIHADPKSFTSGGHWRSKRGKSKEADARRAEFKAAGGAIVTGTMPTVAPAATAMPGLPTAETRAAPISYDTLFAKATGLMQAGKITADRIIGMYGELGIDPNTFATNESARAAMYDALVKLDV